jgi:predicted RNA binding protein YcfA (HicA-like mRNA interferase family)
VKRRDIISLLERGGWGLLRDVGPHTVYGKGSARLAIPRHTEIKENLAKSIIKKIGDAK